MAMEKCLSLALLLVLLLSLSPNDAAASLDSQAEAEALLRWKASLLQRQALSSWSLLPIANASTTQDSSPCNWTGISCNSAGRVTEISLQDAGLQGSIPSSFKEMISLSSIDFSYNDLEGPLPDSKAFRLAPSSAFIKNKGLCGEAEGIQPCNSSLINPHDRKKDHKVVIIIPIMAALFLLLVFATIFSIFLQRSRKTRNAKKGDVEMKNGNLFAVCNFDGKIAYEDIVRATEDFNYKYCIGAGGYGRVYKADLPMGQIVAVKKLHLSQGGEQADQRNFEKEIQALTEIQHHNIVKLYGFCSHA
ncbi:MDIS1-interacting receptor like kinase 2-like isoform X2 [Magnolia sinica]|uniref:MDIS1-interacting receptor like kinase 2-like isoform X2 n=1 Tax=Magnolia sinica TaxID=86752 RepID=UPI0026594FB6|nr:MDIS1-interacting receptor like kinase 2-like isoform X2 [Magnolia sinica]